MTLSASDHTEIRQLLARCNQTLDLADTEGFLACFAPNGEIDTSDPTLELAGSHRGSDALRKFARASHDYAAGHVRQVSANLLIDGDGAKATVLSYSFVTRDFGPPVGEGQVTFARLVTTGIVCDELVKQERGWVIARREFRHDGLPEVQARLRQPRTLEPVRVAG